MASVDVAVSSDLSPERAWALASDLRRFDEWLTIFGGWRSEVPSQIDVGTRVSCRIKVKGFRHVVDWRVTRYDEPKSIELVGRGRGGIRIGLCLHVEEKGQGGGLLNTRIGNLVAKLIESDVRTSVRNLAALR
jgi:hypothetical protein